MISILVSLFIIMKMVLTLVIANRVPWEKTMTLLCNPLEVWRVQLEVSHTELPQKYNNFMHL